MYHIRITEYEFKNGLHWNGREQVSRVHLICIGKRISVEVLCSGAVGGIFACEQRMLLVLAKKCTITSVWQKQNYIC